MLALIRRQAESRLSVCTRFPVEVFAVTRLAGHTQAGVPSFSSVARTACPSAVVFEENRAAVLLIRSARRVCRYPAKLLFGQSLCLEAAAACSLCRVARVRKKPCRSQVLAVPDDTDAREWCGGKE